MHRIRILNKKTNEIYWTTVEIPEHCVEIPDDGKDYIWDKEAQSIVEKPVDIEKLIASGLAYYQSKAEEFRAIPFIEQLNKADGSTINVMANLTLANLQDWILVAMKAGEVKKANVVNADTGLNEIIELTVAEIARVTAILTERIDNLTALDVKVSNKIKTADEELAIAVFSMSEEQLDSFANSIMLNAEQILQMSDEQFSTYILQLISDIKG